VDQTNAVKGLYFELGKYMSKSSKKLDHLITAALSIEAENAQGVSKLAFMARALVMATLPHSKPDDLYFQRKNGRYTLTMTANPQYGLPYGALVRLLLAWLVTEAVSKKSPEIYLGKSLSAFLKKLSLRNVGGVRGSSVRVRDQLMRLLTCGISCDFRDNKNGVVENEQFQIGRSFKLLWNPIKGSAENLKSTSKIVLATDFYEELISKPIPINFNSLRLLRNSPLQIDIYIWLTYRFSFLKNDVFIPWKLLEQQFGADYANNSQGLRNFKKKFLQALKKVWMIYPAANVCPTQEGLMLYKSDTHVKKKDKKDAGLWVS
jgi:hypothetical protein